MQLFGVELANLHLALAEKLKHFYVCRKVFGKAKSAKNIFTRDKQNAEKEDEGNGHGGVEREVVE